MNTRVGEIRGSILECCIDTNVLLLIGYCGIAIGVQAALYCSVSTGSDHTAFNTFALGPGFNKLKVALVVATVTPSFNQNLHCNQLNHRHSVLSALPTGHHKPLDLPEHR
jgi:hypothetical protein